MRKTLSMLFVPLLVAACGGGGNQAAAPAPANMTPAESAPGNSSNVNMPGQASTNTSGVKTVSYANVQFLQDLNATPYSASYSDNGVNVAGSLTFGSPAQTISMTPMADGGISYGAPIITGVAISSNVSDTNLPAVAMLCQKVAGFSGTGPSGQKSTDVLVASSATRLLSASDLAGQSFGFYREDCYRGGTFPASNLGSLIFDASGNATLSDQSGTSSYTAAMVTMALNGQAVNDKNTGKFEVIFGYKFTKQNGSTGYAIVAHSAPSATSLTKGVVATFTQE